MPETKSKLTPRTVGRPRKSADDKLVRCPPVFLRRAHLAHLAPRMAETRLNLSAAIRAVLDAEMERDT